MFHKKNSAWLDAFDAVAFVNNGCLPDGMPEEVIDLVNKIQSSFQDRYARDLLYKQMQFSALQSQINPHFLYNTLEAIRSKAIIGGNPSVAEMAEKMSRFFRYCISNQRDFVTLQDELLNLKDYFFIQQCRFGDRFTMSTNLIDESAYGFYLPKMTLQPLVENAMYHGLEQKKGRGTIILRIEVTQNKYTIWVCDDGIGMSIEKVNELNEKLLINDPEKVFGNGDHGIALLNVNARIRLYFGDDFGLRINSSINCGTDVEVVLPIMDELAVNLLGRKGQVFE